MDQSQSSPVIRWIIEQKLASDEQGAYRMVFVAALVAFVILWLAWPSSGPAASKEEQAQQRQEMERQIPGSQQKDAL